MKLRRLRIEHFKRFREPLAIEGFADGLNLFAAPNEAGKSTVAEAIRAAFFERHRSGSVEHLRPWGDAGATPTVELEFEIGGRRHHLTKAFLGRRRCELRIDGQPPLDGVAAEDHLAGLLGFRFAGKGASAPEHMGIPGLLWIRQGSAHELADAVAHAADHLRQVLGESLGDLTSSSGDALLRAVEAARNELLTPATGNPRGEYAAALQRREALVTDIDALGAQIAGYRDSVDRLTALRREHLRDGQERPWEAIRRQLQQAQERLADAEGLEGRLASAQASMRQATAQAVALRSELSAFERDDRAVIARAQDVHRTEAAERSAQAEVQAREIRHAQASMTDAQARQRVERARAAAARADLARTAGEMESSLQTLAVSLAKSHEERVRLVRLQAEAESLAVAPADLKTLQECSDSLRDKRVQLDAIATSLEFDLADGQSVRAGAETIAGRARRIVVSRTEIEIDGVGRIGVSPGGTDLGALAAQRDALAAELNELLARIGAATVAEAEERARQAASRQKDAKASRKLLEVLAPQGVEALEADHQARTARLAELRATLAALPEPAEGDGPLPARADAEAEAQRANEDLQAAAAALTQARLDAARAQGAHLAARQELAAAEKTVNDPLRAQRMSAARDSLTDTLAREATIREQAQAIEAELKNANLALLRQDVDRLSTSARQLEQAHERRRQDIRDLEIALETQGALGLEEQHAELEREHEAASRRAQELARRAQALDHLLGLLRDKRAALARRLRAPLQKHLDRYLQILFPGARIEVADDLSPGPITRAGPLGPESGEFEQLSVGTREQMGIVARLAYADLLQEAGRPTLLILDDALVNTDEDRLGQMKRVLYDAASRHQILIFTCHPAAWRDLGVAARPIGS
ncbi:MAG: AAA family ATPase [Gammaproteobacteria bacterium]